MTTIQEFDYRLSHVKGKENVVADALSRLCAVQRQGLRVRKPKLQMEMALGGGLSTSPPCGPFDPTVGPIVKPKSTGATFPVQRNSEEVDDTDPRDLEGVEDTEPRNSTRVEDVREPRPGRTESNRTQRNKIGCHNEAGTVSGTTRRRISPGGDSVIQSYQATNQSGGDTLRLRSNMKVVTESKVSRSDNPGRGENDLIEDEDLINEDPPNEEWPTKGPSEYTK